MADRPAFPHYRITTDDEGRITDFEMGIGMTLRDWFAGQALAGIAANPSTPDQLICLGFRGSKDALAEWAYAAADAMLRARATEQEAR